MKLRRQSIGTKNSPRYLYRIGTNTCFLIEQLDVQEYGLYNYTGMTWPRSIITFQTPEAAEAYIILLSHEIER